MDETLSSALKHIKRIEKSGKNIEEKLASILKEHTIDVYAMGKNALFIYSMTTSAKLSGIKEILANKRKRYAQVPVRVLDELKAKCYGFMARLWRAHKPDER